MQKTVGLVWSPVPQTEVFITRLITFPAPRRHADKAGQVFRPAEPLFEHRPVQVRPLLGDSGRVP